MAMGRVGALAVMTIDTARRADQWYSAYLVTVMDGRAQRVVFYEDLTERVFPDRGSAAAHALEIGLACAHRLNDKVLSGALGREMPAAALV